MSEQPKEYIITEKQLDALEKCEAERCDGDCGDDICPIEIGKAIRSRPHPAPSRSGCDGCRKETEHLECPMPGHCDQMKCPICCEGSDFPTLPEEIKKYEAEAAHQAREEVLDEMIKLSMMIETNETERWESRGRSKNDGYINGSHSGYGHALRDMRQWIDNIKKAESLRGERR